MSDSPLDRRRFLAITGALGVAGLAVNRDALVGLGRGTARADGVDDHLHPERAHHHGGGAPGPAPPRSSSHRGARVDRYTLDLGLRVHRLGPYRARLRTYGLAGQAKTIPGPLLVTRPGNVLRVRMRNRMGPKGSGGALVEANAPAGLDPHNNPHDYNVTNLHVHGLQVRTHIFSPLGSERPDAPMMRIAPGEEQIYEFELPEDHPAGLFAYHPHWHGSTASQVMSGAAGAIVVRGEIDEIPEIAACREFVVAINSIYLHDYRQPPGRFGLEFAPYEPPSRGGFDVPPFHLYTVNGRPVHRVDAPDANGEFTQTTSLGAPTLRMRPGEIVRLRLLNATALDALQIVASDGDMRWFSNDGIQMDEPRQTGRTAEDCVFIPPLGRSEVLLRAPDREGNFGIQVLPNTLSFQPLPAMTLIRVAVRGSRRRGMRFPGRLPRPTREYPLIQPKDVMRERTFEWSVDRPFPTLILDTGFLIDNRVYETDEIAGTTHLGAIEKWTFRNVSPFGHPVHIHVNSMQVVDADLAPTQPRFCDVLWVPGNAERSMYMRFKTWPGKTVMHCHILPHEDQGMMTNFMIARTPGT